MRGSLSREHPWASHVQPKGVPRTFYSSQDPQQVVQKGQAAAEKAVSKEGFRVNGLPQLLK